MVLVKSELLGQFLNTLTDDYKYSHWNHNYLWQQVPRQVSLKRKIFSASFIAFVKYTSNLEYFEQKDQSHSLSINDIINCETGS